MRPTWWEIVVIAVLLAVLAVFLWPVRVNGPPGWQSVCMNNIRQIGFAMLLYAGEHDGRYPESLGVLLKEEPLLSPKTFICRASGNKVPVDFPKVRPANPDLSMLDGVDAWSDYVMVKGINHAGRKDVIVLYEKPGRHKGDGRHCFFDDGHVERLSEADFQERMKTQEARMPEMREKGVE
ncbi:MAG TPA: hypothetical protein VMZ92_20605 [Planctomycetota bacterium]|nr:hypothetical protein [Planctomycetota bacterium]